MFRLQIEEDGKIVGDSGWHENLITNLGFLNIVNQLGEHDFNEVTFDDVWVQPAPGDAGSALGAALWYWHHELGNAREPGRDAMSGAQLGPAYDSGAVRAFLDDEGVALAVDYPALHALFMHAAPAPPTPTSRVPGRR